jgi:hypothetical protein
VFTAPDGQPLHPDWLTRRFRRLVAASGLPPVRLHDLRHGAASLALAAGADLKTVQAMLGHASIALTADTYTSVLPELLADSAEATARLVLAHAACKPGRRPSNQVRSGPPKSATPPPRRRPEPKRPKRSGRRRDHKKAWPTYVPRTSHKDQGRIAMYLYGLLVLVRRQGLEPRTRGLRGDYRRAASSPRSRCRPRDRAYQLRLTVESSVTASR